MSEEIENKGGEAPPEADPKDKGGSFDPFGVAKPDDTGKKLDNKGGLDDGDDDGLDKDDAKVIDSRIDARTGGMAGDISDLKANQAVDGFLSDEKNAIYKPFASKIREYAKHPSAKGMTVEAIARIAVDPRNLVAQGAEEERKAQLESGQGMTTGSSGRSVAPAGDLPDAFGLSEEAFDKATNNVKRPVQPE